AESQLTTAIEAVAKRDTQLATRVVEGDVEIDELDREVETLVVRLLALRQPMARDLRQIVASLKISADLERIGDYAANVAKRSLALSLTPPVRPVHAIARMGAFGQRMVKDMIEDPRNITACTHLLFMAKNLERVGDLTTNIAETIYFFVHGVPLNQMRPKRDRTSSQTEPGGDDLEEPA